MKRNSLVFIAFAALGASLGAIMIALPSCGRSVGEYDASTKAASTQAARNDQLQDELRQDPSALEAKQRRMTELEAANRSTLSNAGGLAAATPATDSSEQLGAPLASAAAEPERKAASRDAASGMADGKNGRKSLSPASKDKARADGHFAKSNVATKATDELWVIEKASSGANARKNPDDAIGPGALLTTPPGETREVAVPLKHTDVQAQIDGYIASVNVKQTFHNPYSGKIEAVYVFPLPDNAAVSEFIMTVGDRHIRAIIREREEAQRVYNEARSQGYVASLLTQERPNIFTQKVANIEPGKSIDIDIRYFNTLSFSGDSYEFVFPMVVGPRFNPPSIGTKGIGAAPRDQPGASGQKTEVSYLCPDECSCHNISLSVSIDAGVPIEQITCRTHAITFERPSPNTAKVVLSKMDAIPNRDLVLSYRVASDAIKPGILVHRDDTGGYFSMLVVPPADLKPLQRAPVEMVFVLDTSGSMSGRPIEQSKAAAARSLKRLQDGDSFQIIDFSNTASQLGPYTLEANPENVRKGLDYLRQLGAGGGTMMTSGIHASLGFPHDATRTRYVCFLTDGYIGNEAEILRLIHSELGPSRIFSFGIGTSVNRYLINHMASVGKGAAGYVNLADSSEEVMDTFFDRVSHPAMSNLKIDWAGAEVSDVYPAELPDLFVGRPVVITGRINGSFTRPVHILGSVGQRDITIGVPVPLDEHANRAALAKVWARAKIADLADRSTWQFDAALQTQIKQVALDYGLLSEFTAMVAVDSLARTAGDHGTTVAVPVPVPEGVKYETTVPFEQR